MEKHFTRTRSAACQCRSSQEGKKKHKESLTPTWRMIQILSHFLDLVATGWMDGWMDGLRVTSSLLSIQPFPQNIVYH
jgi:hypothetical protein